MRVWERMSRVSKGAVACTVAATLLGATVSASGFHAGSVSTSSAPTVFATEGTAYRFVGQFVDEVVEHVVEQVNAAQSTVQLTPELVKSAAGLQAVPEQEEQEVPEQVLAVVNHVQSIIDNLDDADVDAPSTSQLGNTLDSLIQQLTGDDLLAALLGFLTDAEAQTLAGIDMAEAAVLAQIEAGRAQVIAQMGDFPELQATVLGTLDLVEQLVRQAFDEMRASVRAQFAEARARLLEAFTGIELPEIADDLLAELEAILAQVQKELDEVQDLLAGLTIL